MLRPLKTLMEGIKAIENRDFNVKFLSTGQYEIDRLIEVYNEMMDELRTERTYQEQQHFFLEKLIISSPTGIVILDYEGNIQQINPKALQILGLRNDDYINNRFYASSHPLYFHIINLPTEKSIIIKADGLNTYKLQKSHFIDKGFSRQFVLIEDLTNEILDTEKNVYSKVIRMMAHEVNNTIGPVNSILQSALKIDQFWGSERIDNLKVALQVAIERNQNLNLFMQNFAELVKLPNPNKQHIDLNSIIKSVTNFLTTKANENKVKFSLNLSNEPFTIFADEQQMEQAFINIIKNAIEAIEFNGEVIFTAYPEKSKLVISDNGVGINYEQAENIFSPFYSTKKDGQGIGLTVVREIFVMHNFEFSLKTVKKGQTEFTILF